MEGGLSFNQVLEIVAVVGTTVGAVGGLVVAGVAAKYGVPFVDGRIAADKKNADSIKELSGLVVEIVNAHRNDPVQVLARRAEMNAAIDDSVHRDDGTIHAHVKSTTESSVAKLVAGVEHLGGRFDTFADALGAMQKDVSNLAGQLQGYDRRRVEVPSPAPGSLGQSPRYTPDPAR